MQQRPKKILSFLLALALIISMPTGITAAEAALPLETADITDSGASPEDLAPPSEASPLGVSLFEADTTPPDLPDDKVCEIGPAQYETVQEAVDAAGRTATIKLLKSFTSLCGIVVDNKNITFDLDGETLEVVTTDYQGLRVIDGSVALTGSGALNVTGRVYGVWANNGSATVTNASASETDTSASASGTGVYAMGGSAVTVNENAYGAAYGVWADTTANTVTIKGSVANAASQKGAVHSNGARIVVKGSVESLQGYGIYTADAGNITVEGSVNAGHVGVMAEGVGIAVTIKGGLRANTFGAILSGNAALTVDGEMTVTGPVAFIRIGSTDITKAQGVSDPGKPGYLKYADRIGGSPSAVWVKDPTASVCEIDGVGYGTLDTGLASFSGPVPKTVKLLQTIDYSGGLVLTDKRVQFDLNGYNLNISNPDGIGLEVRSGAWVQHTGNGELNVSGKVGVRAENVGTIVSVTNAMSTGGTDSAGVYASYSQITVTNNVTGGETGVLAQHTWAQVLVKGDVTGSYIALRAQNTARITVEGNVSASYTGALVEGIPGTVPEIVVEKNLTSSGIGTEVRSSGGSVTVGGDISAAAALVRIGSVNLSREQGVADSGKPGFVKYSAPGPVSGAVWAKGYVITVNSGIADPSIATQGTTITLVSSPAPDGQRFKNWSITPSVTFVEGGLTSATAKFSMPAQAVTATAAYEAVGVDQPTYYTVTINGSYADNSGADSYTQGSVVTVYAGSRNGYSFTGWSSLDGVSFASAGSESTTFIMPAKDVMVTAGWRASGGGNGNGGGSGNGGNGGGSGGSAFGSPAPVTTPALEKKPDQPITAVVSVTATVGENGIASINIPDKELADAIAKAQSDARAQGRTGTGIGVELNINMPQGVSALLATLSKSSLQRLVSSGVSGLSINGTPVSLGLDQNALREIQRQSGSGITIGIAPQTVLSPQAQRSLGKRPAYNITVGGTDQNGKPHSIISLGSGTATITIPYRRAGNETPGYLFGVYVDGSGKSIRIRGSVYDVNSRRILIPTNHFSVYGVGYEAPKTKFTDAASHWAKDSIDYTVGRGLLSGTSKTNFSPDIAMTRGMLAAALGKLAGVDIKAFTRNSFTDVKEDSSFRPYIEWAYSKGIVPGTGNSQFAPDRAITREEIAVILQSYAKATGYKLPVIRSAVTFADASSVGSAYMDAVTAMQQAGIMVGKQNNKFNPKSNATRAEASAMLHRYIKLTIDPETAQSWALNDDGQSMYYKDGKAVTGAQTIDGVTYFFNTDGTLKPASP